MKVAFQGEIGAFSEEAACVLFPEAEVVPCLAFEDVFEAVEAGRVERGVVPIENSLFGSVHVNYDLLRAHNVRIVAELNLRVRHNLMALPGVTLADVRQVLSHPQALGQCRDYLRRHLAHAEAVPVYDTAGAAKMVATQGRRDAAAIASRQAAAEYGLHLLAEGIESNRRNYTRFLALAREADAPVPEGVPCKTSIVYAQRENVPGGLFKSLAVFALRDIDLLKIESRPLVGHPGKYLFYLDLAGSLAQERVRRALDHLGEIAAEVKVLGSYPVGETTA
ncbi:prephenate dehydratase [Rhodocaloribacter litoris]|uniref:prephenate dehydratase n=1 Tax=Rhodocaloribacter litoris TaxID=2558931 RepID=UPI0014233EE5|nr:prephenate dehydratase [Rhodocaloribacter litoris]QXD16551.1 prephenate dehydratase [Rhodocaloribacter litoris]GIV59527.1 MAG: prephenate dehydratase [Rhodothermaceae bacterium]